MKISTTSIKSNSLPIANGASNSGIQPEAPVYPAPSWMKRVPKSKQTKQEERNSRPLPPRLDIESDSSLTMKPVSAPPYKPVHETANLPKPRKEHLPREPTPEPAPPVPNVTTQTAESGMCQPYLSSRERSFLLGHATLTAEQKQKLLASFGLKQSAKSDAHLKQVFAYVFLDKLDDGLFRGYDRVQLVKALQQAASGERDKPQTLDSDMQAMLSIVEQEARRHRDSDDSPQPHKQS